VNKLIWKQLIVSNAFRIMPSTKSQRDVHSLESAPKIKYYSKMKVGLSVLIALLDVKPALETLRQNFLLVHNVSSPLTNLMKKHVS
jgi:hypothetical protein